MAEREGFEPPIPVKVCPLSRRIVSTTHAPLRAGQKPSSVRSVESPKRLSFRSEARNLLCPPLTCGAQFHSPTDDFERTFAALPRCVRRAPRPELPSYGSVADDSQPALPNAQTQLWDHPT